MTASFLSPKLQQQQYMSLFFKNSRTFRGTSLPLAEVVRVNRDDWFNSYMQRRTDFTLQELLNPARSHLVTSEGKQHSITSSDGFVVAKGRNGLWQMQIRYIPKMNIHDFEILVLTGGNYMLHPEVIKTKILRYHGEAAFKEWRQMVVQDISSLKELVQAMRRYVKKTIPSITCCDSSERLCEKVGIPVRKSIAFLFPE